MYRLVLLRHGQSVWNRDKRFTGWTDVGLSDHGETEARAAAATLVAAGYSFDVCFTSVLKRATDTARVVLESMNLTEIPVYSSWRLNERHYGALQGLSFLQGVLRYGPLVVVRCHFKFSALPPRVALDDPRFPGSDPAYKEVDPNLLPRGESLEDTLERVQPYWEEAIVPQIRAGRRVLIVAHRNSLRALLKYLEGVPDKLAPRVKAPTDVPQVCELDDALNVVHRFDLRQPS
jgi:2,3-bisphosphoglycerate-dependent phosphoglycerate mutase